MGHVELPDSDRTGPVGLVGAPRPRTVSNRPRSNGLDELWQAPAAPRERSGPAAAKTRATGCIPVVAGVELLGLGVPALLVLRADGQSRAALAAAAAALAWSALRAVRGRYAQRPPGGPSGVLSTAGDWLLFIGVLAVLHTATGDALAPATAVVALLPGLSAGIAAQALRRLPWPGRRPRAVRRVLVVGEAPGVDRAVRLLAARADHPYSVVAAVPVGTAPLECGVPVPGRLAPAPADDDVSTVLGGAFAQDADLALVVPGPQLSEERLCRLSWGLHDGGLALSVLPGLSGIAAGRVRATAAAGLTLLHIAPPLRRGPQPALKALVDRVGAALGLLVLTPLLVLIGAAVRFGSDGPVFHRQIRQGQHNRPFTMWKFRTMVADAEAHKDRLRTANEIDGPMFKMRRDPRVTGIGRLLRRTSLDELPQLLNVLRGDMSLVGPRPPLPEEVSRYDEREFRRLSVKPGLTGLWQVSGRSDLSWQETVSLDLWYVDNWSMATDMGLMARTLRAVTDGRGAY
ncbi:sugar transferase [Streptomyces sp. NBC_00257]|uniref:sugar transferase n=1 Tax=unclassified Streptomyces TaxID=2593676 RepID=UPI00225306C1|nr:MULTISPECIES: sugar transferase [unclassified Streptomyces]WTB59563.1 sugar transferase [Streptomyces sp. NBC_00826]WTH95855.1 sugar transferase [Streptomyces sp. NBC_00825]WTI04576.1 sugar transferase [Streptomyces sp. NBC_00822]MCX4868961.1 sugar transferase [Streptomyces sp. NBC_00906]MCX4900199.1 sugar transferase [Streptomyces sp. NBC_00892]